MIRKDKIVLITRKSHEKYMTEYINFISKVKINMHLVVNQHKKMELQSDIYGQYYPCEYVETLDEEFGIIKVYEPSINKYHEVCVNNLVIL